MTEESFGWTNENWKERRESSCSLYKSQEAQLRADIDHWPIMVEWEKSSEHLFASDIKLSLQLFKGPRLIGPLQVGSGRRPPSLTLLSEFLEINPTTHIMGHLRFVSETKIAIFQSTPSLCLLLVFWERMFQTIGFEQQLCRYVGNIQIHVTMKKCHTGPEKVAAFGLVANF